MRLALLTFLLLAGCYKTAPDEDELRTVPVTNNPHALPGPIRSNPLQALGY
jgi:hypothetical protein